MNRWSKLAVAAFIGLAAYGPMNTLARETLEPGAAVPEMNFQDTNNQSHSLSDLLGPKGVLLVFWATWSPRSHDILTFLGGLQKKYANQGMQVIAVNVEHEGMDPTQIEEISRKYKEWSLPWPSYFDPKLDALSSLGIVTLPTSLYVGADRKVAAVYPGFPTGEGRASLVELLEKSLGIWVAPSVEEKPTAPQYVPKAGAGQRARLGRRLFERNQKRKSVEEFQHAVKADPDFAMAYAAAAFVAREADMPTERDSFVAELERRRGEPPFQEALGISLMTLERTDEARQVLQPLTEAETPMVRGLLALAYLNYAKAQKEAYESILTKLKAWPKGDKTFVIDLSTYLAPDSPVEAQWDKPLPFFLKLLDLPPPLGFGVKAGVLDALRATPDQAPR